MAKINVEPAKLRSPAERMDGLARDLSRLAGTVDSIRGNLRDKIAGREEIAARLREVSAQLSREENAAKSMKSGLEHIRTRYEQAENANLGWMKAEKDVFFSGEFASYADVGEADFWGRFKEFLGNFDAIDIADFTFYLSVLLNPPLGLSAAPLYEFLKKYITVTNYTEGIEDETTRELIKSKLEYAYQIMRTYQKSDGKARQILDKYNRGIAIDDMNALDDGTPANYYESFSMDKFFLNADSSLKDPRTPQKVFYHEYGHYVVDKTGWVSYDENGTPYESESFAKFHQALDREAKAYIAGRENQARQELHAKFDGKYTEEQIESLVHNRTVELMKADTGNSASYRVNGVSDILSGASNDRYSIGYHHDADYWAADYTNQGNEGFAQFFSADVNHNTVEIEFMQQYFPEAYQAYQDLLDEALQ